MSKFLKAAGVEKEQPKVKEEPVKERVFNPASKLNDDGTPVYGTPEYWAMVRQEGKEREERIKEMHIETIDCNQKLIIALQDTTASLESVNGLLNTIAKSIPETAEEIICEHMNTIYGFIQTDINSAIDRLIENQKEEVKKVSKKISKKTTKK